MNVLLFLWRMIVGNLMRLYLTTFYKFGKRDFSGLYLVGASLAEANLTGANLTGANLTGASLTGASLKDVKGVFIKPNIGSRSATLIAFMYEGVLYFKTGCFEGTKEEFVTAVKNKHVGRDNKYKKAYMRAVKEAELYFKDFE